MARFYPRRSWQYRLPADQDYRLSTEGYRLPDEAIDDSGDAPSSAIPALTPNPEARWAKLPSGDWGLVAPLGYPVGTPAVAVRADGTRKAVALGACQPCAWNPTRGLYAVGEAPVVTPAASEAPSATPDVPAGYYALPSATGNNDLDFYRVDRPTDGKWAGFVFVKRIVGGEGEIRVRGSEAARALAAIAIDSEAAGRAYANAIGSCYRCNRSLTDEISRALGIGPTCRGHQGAAAKAALVASRQPQA